MFVFVDRYGFVFRNLYVSLSREKIRRSFMLVSATAYPGGGRYFRNFWVSMCHWDPGTLNLYQS